MKSSDIWDELGNTYFKAEVLEKAMDAYGKAIEQKTVSGWTYANLASIFVQRGRFSDAIPLYQQSLELLPNHKDQAVIWGRLGNIYNHLNEHGKAIQAYQKADEILPRRSSEKNSMIIPRFKTRQDNQDEAAAIPGMQAVFTNGQDGKVNPGENNEEIPQTDEQMAGQADFDGEYPGESVKNIERNANVWNELGLILFKVGSYDDAIDAYQQAIRLEPAYGWLYSNLGQVVAIQGKLSQAVEFYEKSIKLLITNKEKAVSWTRLGDIYRQLDKYDEAMAAYQLADALNQTVAEPINDFRQVDPDLILTNPCQSRVLEDIEDLSASVRVHGIIQPLIVCPGKNEPEKYMLIAGYRRLEAAKRAGLRLVPVIVRRASDQEIIELSLNENIHCAMINPFDLAKGYRQMANDYDLSIEEISERVGRSPHSVANAMKVIEPIDEIVDEPETSQVTHDLVVEIEMDAQIVNPDSKSGLNGNSSENENNKILPPMESRVQVGAAEVDQAPKLWYSETDNDVPSTRLDDDHYAGTSSLLTRARHVLKCNPHNKRPWAVPTFRA